MVGCWLTGGGIEGEDVEEGRVGGRAGGRDQKIDNLGRAGKNQGEEAEE